MILTLGQRGDALIRIAAENGNVGRKLISTLFLKLLDQDSKAESISGLLYTEKQVLFLTVLIAPVSCLLHLEKSIIFSTVSWQHHNKFRIVKTWIPAQ